MTPDVCVIGLGYVGLPSVLIFAFKGCRVIGVDVDKRKVDMVNAGMPYIREPKLEEILFEVLKSGRFQATTDYSVISECGAVLVDVPTLSGTMLPI